MMAIPAAMSLSLSLAPQLRHTLAPELRQSLRLLQMSYSDLEEHLRQLESDNPLLELEWREEYRYGSRTLSEGCGRIADPQPVTLERALLAQLRMTKEAPERIRAASFLAGSLSDNGYLEIEADEAAACLGVSAETIESALALLRSLEPAGVAARSLEECLLLQAARDPSAPDGAEIVIREHLRDIAKGRWRAISRSTGLPLSSVQRIVAYIRGLNPRPGAAFAASDAPYVVPEARIGTAWESGGSRVQVLEPVRVRIHSYAESGATEWRRWVAAKKKEAHLLLEMLRFRATALESVMVAIMEKQRAFVTGGPEAIKPLKLEQIAEATGYHLSTVSRAVRDKYVDTPFGVYPLSGFFSAGLPSIQGREVSSVAVKRRIRAYIREENKRSPLTDIQIAELLGREGIAISRRTVAKYREEERLLPSALRAPAPAGKSGV